VVAQAPAQGLVQQVGRRMVRPQAGAPGAVDPELHRVAQRELALHHLADVDVEVAKVLLGVVDAHLAAAGGKGDAAVAHLAAGLAVERGLVDQQLDRLAGFGHFHGRAVDDDGPDLALARLAFVAEELGGAVLFAQLVPQALGRRLAGADPRLAGGGALALHGGIEAGLVDAAALAAQDVLGQVEGKAVGVVELEGAACRSPRRAASCPGRGCG
jgi:hypothetical protein